MSYNSFDYERYLSERRANESQLGEKDINISNIYPVTFEHDRTALNPVNERTEMKMKKIITKLTSDFNISSSNSSTRSSNSSSNSISISVDNSRSSKKSELSYSSSQQRNELKYIMYLAKKLEDDKDLKDNRLLILNQEKLKQEVNLNLGIFANELINKFGSEKQNAVKITKKISEFIPGKQNIPPCTISITITAENFEAEQNLNKPKPPDQSADADELKSVSSSHTTKSFTQEAKSILENCRSKSTFKIESNNDVSNLNATSAHSSASNLFRNNEENKENSGQLSHTLNEPVSKKVKKHVRKKKSQSNLKSKPSHAQEYTLPKLRPKKPKKSEPIYSNEPIYVYSSSGHLSSTDDDDSASKAKKSSTDANNSPSSNTVVKENLAPIKLYSDEHIYASLDTIPDENLNQTEESYQNSKENLENNRTLERNNSLLLDRILLIDHSARSKKEEAMFHSK